MRIALNLFPQFEVVLELLVDPPLESLDRLSLVCRRSGRKLRATVASERLVPE